MLQGLVSMGMMVGERLKLYLKGSFFKPFHNVVHNLLGFGMKERILNRYFMLDIVRNGYVLDNPLMKPSEQQELLLSKIVMMIIGLFRHLESLCQIIG